MAQMIFGAILFLVLPIALGLVGYDCGSRSLNITTLSLLDVGPCEVPQNTINVTREYVQLLQLNEYSEATVIQCKLEIKRTVYYCGMYSHISIVNNGESEYLYDVSRKACQELHRSGTFMFANAHAIAGVKVNRTVTHSMQFAGFVNSEGTCNGGAYSDPYGTWENVVVQGIMKISLKEYSAKVKLNNNKIFLKSGTVCDLSEESCIDVEGGHTFWSAIPRDSCKFDQYGVLYEGFANKMIDLEYNKEQTIYSLSTNDVTFALSSKRKEYLCGYTIIRTEHPKLVIFETVRGQTFANRNKIAVSNLDIFAYVNSKFVFVEKHIRHQIKQLYRDVVVQRCNIERQTLKNALAIATQAPDEFAYHLMKGPGYMALVAGEVVHVIKCIPVEVKVKHSDNCYSELEVTKGNKTMYLTPRTHILKLRGTQISCNNLLPAYYSIEGVWYKILPKPTDTKDPITIHPNSKTTWEYKSPESLATSGIYTEKDLNELRERIMFPVEKPALLNDVAREMHGHTVTDKEGTLTKLLNADAVEKILKSTWDRVWMKFLTFGTVSAGVIGILLIFHLIKTVIDIGIQGYTLHAVYGWSIHLLGAVWGSITYLLLYLNKAKAEETPEQQQQDIEMQEPLRELPTTSQQKKEEDKKEERDGFFSRV